ncbi:MAG: aldo/keto reductase [Oscillospiraceae bacterium]|nr:aldo/keto reductase [Oscillospiraceae bacterium]
MEYLNVKGLTTPVSSISFGTATSTLEEEENIHKMLDYYVSKGGNYIDTSRFYGRGSGIQRTEEILSRWLAKDDNRSKVVIQSKCCTPYMNRHLVMFEEMPRVGRTYMYDDILFSLDHLGVDCIDMYLTHRDNPNVPVSEIMDTFEDFLRRGWIKSYGVSNWTLERFAEAYEYCERMGYQGPSIYSPFFSLVKLEKPWFYRIAPFKDEWLSWFEEHKDVVIAAWSSQGRGFFGNYPQYDPDKADAATRMAVLTPENLARKERVLEISAKNGIRPSQISLLYVLSQKAKVAAIIGPRSCRDIDNVLEAAKTTLTQAEIDYLTLKSDKL